MRTLALVGAVIIAGMSLAAAPAMAGKTVDYKISNFPNHIFQLCLPPAQLEKECVSWGPAGPGQLFGPCLKYALQCETPPNIQ